MAKTFEILYQAAGAGTGKTVNVSVYKPDKTLDATQSGTATEVGTTGRYHKAFDADAPGWFCEIEDSDGGKAIKHFDQDRYDSHGVADAVADVDTAVAAANTALSNLDTALSALDTKTSTIIADVGTVQSDVTSLLSQLATVSTKIDNLDAPPMVG